MWRSVTLVKAGDLLDLARMAAASHSGVTLQDIRKRFGVSHRTVQRMKDRLLVEFQNVEETEGHEDRKRRWRLTRPPMAPICLVSMATSGEDEIPRGVEFLFSPNRLNVAISRAQALAVVLCSERLLNVKCGSVREVGMISALCSIEKVAGFP